MKRSAGIQLGSDYDLQVRVVRNEQGLIVSGLCVGNTLEQRQALLLLCQKGEVKEDPLLGVGIGDIVNDHDFRLWKREIIDQFERDGQRIERLVITPEGLEVRIMNYEL
jgi:hypothetical protein